MHLLTEICMSMKVTKLDNLVAHPGTILGDPDDIVHMDWTRPITSLDNMPYYRLQHSMPFLFDDVAKD